MMALFINRSTSLIEVIIQIIIIAILYYSLIKYNTQIILT